MNNPSGTTHDHTVPSDEIETQLATIQTIKDNSGLFADIKKNDPMRFVVCDKSVDGRHNYEKVMQKTIRVKLNIGGTEMVNSYTFDGYRHFYEQCTSCSKLTMSCERLV